MVTFSSILTHITDCAAALATETGRSTEALVSQAPRNGLDAWEREYRFIQAGSSLFSAKLSG